MPKSFLHQVKFVISEMELKKLRQLGLSLNEAFLMIYFINQKVSILNIPDINKVMNMDENTIMETFSSLMEKKIINLEMVKNEEKKLEEVVNLDSFYESLEMDYQDKDKSIKKSNIFEKFESEFGRTLTPMELEIINGWLKNNTSEEIILGALKEATYNGVNSLRYIDKIIFEWNKKGYKKMSDISNNQREVKNDKKELFDYDWLNSNDK